MVTTFTKSTAVIIQISAKKSFTKFLLLTLDYDAASAPLLNLCKQNFIYLQAKNIDETKASGNETVLADLDQGLR